MPRRAPSAPPAYPRVDPRAGDGVELANRLGGTDRLCETLFSWRLLVGGLTPAASHHSCTTSSEEPPLSNFNSYRECAGELTNDRRGRGPPRPRPSRAGGNQACGGRGEAGARGLGRGGGGAGRLAPQR